MISALAAYARWLHGRWPSGTVEKLPDVDERTRTDVPGLYVVGDLTGIPLLKLSADSGARAVAEITADPAFQRPRDDDGRLDVVIVGGGVSGMSAALAARDAGLSYQVLEATEPFSTIVNFPKGKPIYTYPRQMTPAGDLRFEAEVKEGLLDELRAQTLGRGIEVRTARVERVERSGNGFDVVLADAEPLRARRVIVAIGRSGNYRRLDVPGEDLDKVSNRLHDPADHVGQQVLVVGGGDSAAEAAVALADAGARVTLSYRGAELSRPKPGNVEALEASDVDLMLASRVRAIEPEAVLLSDAEDREVRLDNDAVYTMIGREPPLDFFRRSGVRIRGEWTPRRWLSLGLILLAAVFVYHWKTDAGLPVKHWFQEAGWFPFNLGLPADATSLWGTLRVSATQPAFYYSLAYSLAVVVFGWRRVRRRDTPYVRVQTATLAAIQVLPLFLLPYVLLPWAGHNGWFDPGAALQPVADALFPVSEWAEHGREYWRVLGLILAWPLFLWNVFTDQPMWAWLAIGAVQTFVLIPAMIYVWGKGAYCGWICSCGALAETVGDAHRHKMPHGPGWNRLNMLGQAILLLALALLALRLLSWAWPEASWIRGVYMGIFMGRTADWGSLPFPFSYLNYQWSVDLLLAGILGVGLYWHFSGRMWCRFACPLAALMHVYARFSRFRILADKKKCISCNVCTSVCHQGIDIMGFANKGLPMADPQCVRCSACVESCPTGVLSFGQVDAAGQVIHRDRLSASPVRARETTHG